MAVLDALNVLPRLVVACFALFLIGLAALIVLRPAIAERFLGLFASSAMTHYFEQAVRLLVGLALVQLASAMRYPELFRVFGWVMVVSTIGLLLTPWRWHHRFAARVMPPVIRHMTLFAFGSFALGAFIAYSALMS